MQKDFEENVSQKLGDLEVKIRHKIISQIGSKNEAVWGPFSSLAL